MDAEQEYKQLKSKLTKTQKELERNTTLQELKQAALFKKLKVGSMEDAEVAIKKLGKSAKKAEISIQKLLIALKEQKLNESNP